MDEKLPDIRIFDYYEEADVFIAGQDYQLIANTLGLREWNSVVWIGRLFALDNDFGEHWFDNFDQEEEEDALSERLGRPGSRILRIHPDRFKDGQDGPCHTDDFRKKFWTDVLRSLKLNLGTLIEKARQQNEKYEKTAGLKDFYQEDLEDSIEAVISTYAPNHPLLKEKIFAKAGLDEQIIKQIAEELDTGMICYVHRETKEVKSVMDPDSRLSGDLEGWEEDIEEVEANYDQYWRIEPMSSSEGYRVMEQYTAQLDNENLKNRLTQALHKRKPFQNFKFVIDNSGSYREKWFAFRNRMYEEYVIEQIEGFL